MLCTHLGRILPRINKNSAEKTRAYSVLWILCKWYAETNINKKIFIQRKILQQTKTGILFQENPINIYMFFHFICSCRWSLIDQFNSTIQLVIALIFTISWKKMCKNLRKENRWVIEAFFRPKKYLSVVRTRQSA